MASVSPQTDLHDIEKGIDHDTGRTGRFKPTPDDDACFGLWNVYIDQAQQYDKALIKRWKSDMDGMLFFSALYSAVLAAFIIESYRKLQEDPADTTVALLVQMSQQIALLSNGTIAPSRGLPDFQPTTSFFVCNLFWFLALALALTCSLLATFVLQWTRDFLDKSTMRLSPVVQARVLSFSYFGLRRFRMHTFVDIIPILLHSSLSLFFAGLVGFLLDVNRPLAYLMACVLVIFLTVYLGLSCLPLLHLDAPYRTHLSDLLWRLVSKVSSYIPRRHELGSNLSLTQAIVGKSLHNTSLRDRRCMEYTMQSLGLNHDSELLPMFEAISEAVLSPSGGVRLGNIDLVAPLIQPSRPEHSIIPRISHFISISSTTADPSRRERELKACLKSLWSLARLVIDHSIQQPSSGLHTTQTFWFDTSLLDVLSNSPSLPKDHAISAFALVRASRLQSLKRCIDTVANELHWPRMSAYERIRMAKRALGSMSLKDIHWNSEAFKSSFSKLSSLLEDSVNMGETGDSAPSVDQAQEIILKLQHPGRWKAALISILAEFLLGALQAGSAPMEITRTYELVLSCIPQVDVFDRSILVDKDEALESFVLEKINYPNPNDVKIELLIPLLRLFYSTDAAESFSGSPKCRSSVQHYLIHCSAHQSTALVEQDVASQLEACVLQDLRNDDSYNPIFCVEAIDRLYTSLGLYGADVSPRLHNFGKQIFHLIPTASPKFTQNRWWNLRQAQTEWLLCKNIMKKSEDLTQDCDSQIKEDIDILGQRLLPGVPMPDTSITATEMQTHIMSLILLILSRFILVCIDGADKTPWTSTLALFYHQGNIYAEVQYRFAECISKLVSARPLHQPKDSVAYRVFQQQIWRVSQNWKWITDPKSARLLVETIERHRKDPHFTGMIWHEQALLDRCMKVIEETGGD